MRTRLRSFVLLACLGLWPSVATPISVDDSPPAPGDWGFRPLEAESVVQTPPGFVWRPVPEAASYSLQIATEESFASPQYVRDDLLWSAHCPNTALAPGPYYWRYAARDATGEVSDWSQVRMFRVTEESAPFPQPRLEDLIPRLPFEHPRIFFRPEDIQRFRELGKTSLNGRWKELLEAADQLLREPPDVSEPPKYPEGMERESAEWKKIWWGNRTRAINVADGAALLGFVFRLTGDPQYGEAGRNLLLALCDWDPEGSTSYPYNSEAAMPLLKMTARAYSWNHSSMSPEDRARFCAMMRIRGQQAFDELNGNNHLWRPYNSHRNRAWHFLGELATAFQGEIPEADRWLDYAMTIFYTVYPAWGDSDGGWHEGLAYWISYLQRFLYWESTLQAAFHINIFERPFFQRTGYFGLYGLPPGTRSGAFGDQAALVGSHSVANFVAELAAGAGNPHWQWYAEQTGGELPPGYLGFLRAARSAELVPDEPDEIPSSVCFQGTGVAILNSNILDATSNVQVHFKCSPMGRQSHGYNANNAFLLNVGGRRVFVQSGERDISGSPHQKEWMWESKSDNSILVNGLGQKRHSSTAVGRITAFATSDSVDVVAGECAASYPDRLKRFERRIVFVKPHSILIHDILEATAEATFQWTLHGQGGPFLLGENSAIWKGEPGVVHVQFLRPSGLAVSQTDKFDPPPAEWSNLKLNQWHLLAAPPSREKRIEFLTLISIGESVQPWVHSVTEDGVQTLRLSAPDGGITVGFEDRSFSIHAPGIDQVF